MIQLFITLKGYKRPVKREYIEKKGKQKSTIFSMHKEKKLDSEYVI